LRSLPEALAGFVLAGGRSSRMGRDKALVELDGRTLAALAVDKLKAAGLSAVIAGARSGLGHLAPVVADEAPDEGPLRGVCTALESTKAPLTVFVPVDMPLIPAALLSHLVSDARATGAAVTLVSVNGFTQTFPAVIRTRLLPFLREELVAGRRGCLAAFQAASSRVDEGLRVTPVELLVQAGQVRDERTLPAYQWFLNVNTPEDVERAASLRVS
jgi:molybdopterin-guanine dinucleotide biosynthesis protein A